jgi:hypothetical protein
MLATHCQTAIATTGTTRPIAMSCHLRFVIYVLRAANGGRRAAHPTIPP